MNITGRFKDLDWFPSEHTFCIVGGAGGISSWLSFFLARAGFIPIVFDFDRIEEHNIGGQFYPMDSVGKFKVDSLSQSILHYTGTHIQSANERFGKSSMFHDYMFSGFDNMVARKDMFNVWKARANPHSIFIDGRLQAERLQIMCVRGSDSEAIKYYEESHIFDDSEVEDEPCTMKQTTHTAAIIAGFMVSFFTNHLVNIKTSVPIRTVPKYFDVYLPLTFEKLVI